MAPAKRGERGIRDRHTRGNELFVHADQIAPTLLQQLDNLVAVRFRFFGAVKPWHRGGARFQDRTVPREIWRARAICRIPWPFTCKLKIAVRSP